MDYGITQRDLITLESVFSIFYILNIWLLRFLNK